MSIKCALALLVSLTSAISVAQQLPVSPKQSQVTLTYLGTAGWQITNGKIVLLIDPYFSRLRGKASAPYEEPMPSDIPAIDAHVTRADYILITHAHFDHVMDVPYITKKTGVQVIGNLKIPKTLHASVRHADLCLLAKSIPSSRASTANSFA